MSKHIWLAVDKDGCEWAYQQKPVKSRFYEQWHTKKFAMTSHFQLPIGTIEKLTGSKITYKDKPLKWKP